MSQLMSTADSAIPALPWIAVRLLTGLVRDCSEPKRYFLRSRLGISIFRSVIFN
jgi:hypothetical protein